MPGDIVVDSISDYQMAKLNRLKEWLYQRRTQARGVKTFWTLRNGEAKGIAEKAGCRLPD